MKKVMSEARDDLQLGRDPVLFVIVHFRLEAQQALDDGTAERGVPANGLHVRRGNIETLGQRVAKELWDELVWTRHFDHKDAATCELDKVHAGAPPRSFQRPQQSMAPA